MTAMDKYNWLIRFLHWILGVLIIVMIFVGFIMTNYLTPPIKYNVYNIHKAIGFTLLLFMLFRLVVRVCTKAPPMLSKVSFIGRFAARLTHFLLYLFVILTGLSGYVMTYAAGKTVKWFGLFEIPSFIEKNKEIAKIAHSAHEVLPYILLALIMLHIFAAIKHIFWDKINILKRIT